MVIPATRAVDRPAGGEPVPHGWMRAEVDVALLLRGARPAAELVVQALQQALDHQSGQHRDVQTEVVLDLTGDAVAATVRSTVLADDLLTASVAAVGHLRAALDDVRVQALEVGVFVDEERMRADWA